MRCPYRMDTIICRNSHDSEVEKMEEFADCYGNRCPFYYERWQIIDKGTGSRGNVPHCRKAEKEVEKE